MPDSAAVSMAVGMGVTNTFTVWTTLCPSLPDLRTGSESDVELLDSLRTSERDAAILAMGIAAGVSLIVKSPLPILTSLGLCAALFYFYESARKD